MKWCAFFILACSAVCDEGTGGLSSDARLCSNFRDIAHEETGLERLLTDPARLNQFDLDGDGKSDAIVVSCPGSSPTEQADACITEVNPTRAKPYSLEAWRVFIIEYRGEPFAVASTRWRNGKSPSFRQIYALRSSGAQLICNVKVTGK